jgi:hypothetical protein
LNPQSDEAGRAVCNVIASTGDDLTAGSDFVVQEANVSFIDLVRFRDQVAVLCYRDHTGLSQSRDLHEGRLICALLAVEADDTLSKVSELNVEEGSLNETSVPTFALQRLEDDRALVCYGVREPLFSDYLDSGGYCAVLSATAASGNSLSKGPSLNVYQGFRNLEWAIETVQDDAIRPAVADHAVLACYTRSRSLACLGLTVTGTTVTPWLGAQELDANGLWSDENLMMTSIDSSAFLVCWQALHGATCHSIQVYQDKNTSATSFAIKDGVVHSGEDRTEFGLAQVSSGKALLCTERDTGTYHYETLCKVVTVSASGGQTSGPSTLLVHGEASDIAMAPLQDAFLTCYDYQSGIYFDDPWRTKCDLLTIGAGDVIRSSDPAETESSDPAETESSDPAEMDSGAVPRLGFQPAAWVLLSATALSWQWAV